MNSRKSIISGKTAAVLYLILSAFFFNLMNIFVRLSGDIPSIQKSFFRNLIAMMIAAAAICRSGEGFHPQKKNLPFLVMRSVFGTIGILGNFYAVDHLLLPNASMLNKINPFMAMIFSAMILKEKVHPFQAVVIGIAFIGSLFIIKPTFANLALVPSLIGFIGGVSSGLAYTLVRKCGLCGEKGSTIVLFFSSFSCLIVLPWVVLHYTPMTIQQTVMLLLAGCAAAGGQFSVTAAYSHAPSREISIYDYSQILFAAISGFFIFGELPDLMSFVGYVVLIGAAIAMFRYNNRPAVKEQN